MIDNTESPITRLDQIADSDPVGGRRPPVVFAIEDRNGVTCSFYCRWSDVGTPTDSATAIESRVACSTTRLSGRPGTSSVWSPSRRHRLAAGTSGTSTTPRPTCRAWSEPASELAPPKAELAVMVPLARRARSPPIAPTSLHVARRGVGHGPVAGVYPTCASRAHKAPAQRLNCR